jgi:hypothetical protein
VYRLIKSLEVYVVDLVGTRPGRQRVHLGLISVDCKVNCSSSGRVKCRARLSFLYAFINLIGFITAHQRNMGESCILKNIHV